MTPHNVPKRRNEPKCTEMSNKKRACKEQAGAAFALKSYKIVHKKRAQSPHLLQQVRAFVCLGQQTDGVIV